MLDVAILGQVALGYSPVHRPQPQRFAATRLTVFPLRPDAHARRRPAAARRRRRLAGERRQGLAQRRQREPAAGPAAGRARRQPDGRGAGVHGVGPGQRRRAHRACTAPATRCCSRAARSHELPREVAAVLQVLDHRPRRRAPDRRGRERAARRDAQHRRTSSRACARSPRWRPPSRAARTRCSAGRSTTRSAPARRAAASRWRSPTCRSIVELIHRVDNEEPIEKLENTLKRDPSLAFKLLRYINSPAFGLRVEISSFRHAIMMLGYQRLKRWLALLLATASKDVNLQAGHVRRGAARPADGRARRAAAPTRRCAARCSSAACSRCSTACSSSPSPSCWPIPVPERVYQALVENGPFQPYLRWCARSRANRCSTSARRRALMMSVGEINRAQLRA